MDIFFLMPCDGTLHFDAIAILRGHEARADEQKNHVGIIQVCIDVVLPIGARLNFPITPLSLNTLTWSPDGT
ncbi:MAG TPA: hypothetical protein VFV38_21245 [Ktedonobacteraceae bacterium]|nr:hypothetical protein [Ktedonobacteraceae bacterium]